MQDSSNLEISHRKIIIISFAGRKKYLEIQKHFILGLLENNKNIEYHLWNFSRNTDDNNYLQSLSKQNNQIQIFNQFYEGENTNDVCVKSIGVVCNCKKCRVGKWTEPYKIYANNNKYEKAIFIKLDDDVVFVDVKMFQSYVDTIILNRGKIVSAFVINNGLCSLVENNYKQLVINNIILHNGETQEKSNIIKTIKNNIKVKKYTPSDWWFLCSSVDFFRLSHNYFINNFPNILKQEDKFTYLPKSRFSINTIGFDWTVMKQISSLIGTQESMNDEEIISNAFSIMVYIGFVTVHFHFSDQRTQITDREEDNYLSKYQEIMKEYLEL